MEADGDTALWDALALAKDQILEYAQAYPDAKKRVICISDGADTKSTSNTSQEICWRLRHTGIAVDTISLGNESNKELRTIPHMLGCYSFHPESVSLLSPFTGGAYYKLANCRTATHTSANPAVS